MYNRATACGRRVLVFCVEESKGRSESKNSEAGTRRGDCVPARDAAAARRERCWRKMPTSLLTPADLRRQSHPPNPTSITHTNRKYGRLLPTSHARQGRLALRTSTPRTTGPLGAETRNRRRWNGALSGRLRTQSHGIIGIWADFSRTTARHGRPRHDVRRHCPPQRR
jgi:hypothetical protein